MTSLQKALVDAAKAAEKLESWEIRMEESVSKGKIVSQPLQNVDYAAVSGTKKDR